VVNSKIFAPHSGVKWWLAAVVTFFGFWIAAAAEDSHEGNLAEALKQHYKLASPRLGAKGESLIEPRTILTVLKEGIVSFGDKDASYASLCPAEVEGNAVHAPRTPACTTLAPASRRILKVGDTVCVTAIEVSEARDLMSFFLATCNPGPTVGRQAISRTLVVFHFPRGQLARSTPANIEDFIGKTLSENLSTSSADADLSAPSKPLPDSPLHERSAPPRITTGQTVEQVEMALGPPAVIADVGTRLIYLYPNLKIVFRKRKVFSVE
jgi:hypothetical protein